MKSHSGPRKPLSRTTIMKVAIILCAILALSEGMVRSVVVFFPYSVSKLIA